MSEPTIIWAARLGFFEMIANMLTDGKNPNQQNENGKTALIVAVERGNYDIAELLLKYNADVNIRDHYGWPALMYAQQGSRVEGLLRRYGATVSQAQRKEEIAKLLQKEREQDKEQKEQRLADIRRIVK